MSVERVLNWVVAFCVGYAVGISIAAVIKFGG
jgi:hypothetical protein